MSATDGLAFGKPAPVVGPDGRCHACANCQAEDREANEAVRMAEYGYEVLGSPRPCLRAEGADKKLRQLN